eukprot:m.1332887 g.1332887  ORF g.1332887 m.1332887 type:complete len:421 (+) comp24869_c0_seq28:4183-5445(+)
MCSCFPFSNGTAILARSKSMSWKRISWNVRAGACLLSVMPMRNVCDTGPMSVGAKQSCDTGTWGTVVPGMERDQDIAVFVYRTDVPFVCCMEAVTTVNVRTYDATNGDTPDIVLDVLPTVESSAASSELKHCTMHGRDSEAHMICIEPKLGHCERSRERGRAGGAGQRAIVEQAGATRSSSSPTDLPAESAPDEIESTGAASADTTTTSLPSTHKSDEAVQRHNSATALADARTIIRGRIALLKKHASARLKAARALKNPDSAKERVVDQEMADLESVIKAASIAETKVAACADNASLETLVNTVMNTANDCLSSDGVDGGDSMIPRGDGATASPNTSMAQQASSRRRIGLGDLPNDGTTMIWSLLHRHYGNLAHGLGGTRRDHVNRFKLALDTQQKFHANLLKRFRRAEAEAFAIDGPC